jgi:hypothetical protein
MHMNINTNKQFVEFMTLQAFVLGFEGHEDTVCVSENLCHRLGAKDRGGSIPRATARYI